MNKIDLLQVGDTILVRDGKTRDGKTFVPKCIIMFMRRYKRQNIIGVTGSNTLSGSVAGLTSLTYLRFTGSNTLSGDIGILR